MYVYTCTYVYVHIKIKGIIHGLFFFLTLLTRNSESQNLCSDQRDQQIKETQNLNTEKQKLTYVKKNKKDGMDSCLRTKRMQYGTKNSRPIALFGRQWRHVSSKDTEALAKVTLYKLVTNCRHFSRPYRYLLQIIGSFVWFYLL